LQLDELLPKNGRLSPGKNASAGLAKMIPAAPTATVKEKTNNSFFISRYSLKDGRSFKGMILVPYHILTVFVQYWIVSKI
jgi:hypothetical protein